MVKETAEQEEFLLTTISHFEHYYKITKTSAVRSRISSKLIFASRVGYFDRAYHGFYVTSWRMLVLIEGNKIWQLWKLVSVQIRSMWPWISMRPHNVINSSMTRGDKWSCITRWTLLYHTRTGILLNTVSHELSDIIFTEITKNGYTRSSNNHFRVQRK